MFWFVEQTISKETGDSDSEAENEKILECEEILRHHDPEFEEPHIAQGGAAEFHQVSYAMTTSILLLSISSCFKWLILFYYSCTSV